MRAFGLAVNVPLGTIASPVKASGWESQLYLWLQLPAEVHPGREQVRTEGPGSVPPPQQVHTEFWACSSAWPSPAVVSNWGMSQEIEDKISICLCLSLSFKQIKTKIMIFKIFMDFLRNQKLYTPQKYLSQLNILILNSHTTEYYFAQATQEEILNHTTSPPLKIKLC